MAKKPPSAALRQQLREKIQARIAQLNLTQAEAAQQLGLSAAQMNRLLNDQDIFSLDRLIDAAARLGLSVRLNVTRPYQHG